MSPFLYFLLGVLVGWLLQLTLEVYYFRRKTLVWRDQAAKAVTAWTAAESRSAGLCGELAAVKAELSATQAKLAAALADLTGSRSAPAAARAPVQGPVAARPAEELAAEAAAEVVPPAEPVRELALAEPLPTHPVEAAAQAGAPFVTGGAVAAVMGLPVIGAPDVTLTAEPDGTLDLPPGPATPLRLAGGGIPTAAPTPGSGPAGTGAGVRVVAVEAASVRAAVFTDEVVAAPVSGSSPAGDPEEVSRAG